MYISTTSRNYYNRIYYTTLIEQMRKQNVILVNRKI